MRTIITFLIFGFWMQLSAQSPQVDIIGKSGESGVKIQGGEDGVEITNVTDDGIVIINSGDSGINVFGAGGHGGYFETAVGSGEPAIEARNLDDTQFDIKMVGHGLLASDGNIDLKLDDNNNDVNAFRVFNSANNAAMTLTEEGFLILNLPTGQLFLDSNYGLQVENAVQRAGLFSTQSSVMDAAIEVISGDDLVPDIKLGGNGIVQSDGHFKIKVDKDNNAANDYFRVENSSGNMAMNVVEDGVLSLASNTGQILLLLNKGIHIGGATQRAGFFHTQNTVSAPAVEISSGDDSVADLRLDAHGRITMGGDFNIQLDDNNNGFNSMKLYDSAGNRVFAVDEDGGTTLNTTILPTGYKLAVDGKVICEELTVQLSGSWPDYVFAPEYELLTIEQLKKYVAVNKHLPNIPSASEIEKFGLSVGDMQNRMMEKIEELSLYIIQLQERIEMLENK
jgi:hypothetical protein